MSDLDDFKAKNLPNGRMSKIEPYKKDILDLKSNGYSTKDIVLYLSQYKNIKISVQAVNNFLKKQREKTANRLPEKVGKSENQHKRRGRPPKKEISEKTTTIVQAQPNAQKFLWTERTSKDLI